jgi:hypothetical protein
MTALSIAADILAIARTHHVEVIVVPAGGVSMSRRGPVSVFVVGPLVGGWVAWVTSSPVAEA